MSRPQSRRTEPRRRGLPLLRSMGLDPKAANARFHDAAAPTFDSKWGLAFDARAQAYVRRRLALLPPDRYQRVLDLGCGTGFFLLNLGQLGYVERPYGCDISLEMLRRLRENAAQLGHGVPLVVGDIERLPYRDHTFQLVVGHGFLHHAPDPREVLEEAFRVLSPGGSLLVAGEPTRTGDRVARAVGRLTWRTYRRISRALPLLRRNDPQPPEDSEADLIRRLAFAVDLHALDPHVLAKRARSAGFEGVRVATDEFLASAGGWIRRTLEAEAPDGLLGLRWASMNRLADGALRWIDDRFLLKLLPKSAFSNIVMYGTKPGIRPASLLGRGDRR